MVVNARSAERRGHVRKSGNHVFLVVIERDVHSGGHLAVVCVSLGFCLLCMYYLELFLYRSRPGWNYSGRIPPARIIPEKFFKQVFVRAAVVSIA